MHPGALHAWELWKKQTSIPSLNKEILMLLLNRNNVYEYSQVPGPAQRVLLLACRLIGNYPAKECHHQQAGNHTICICCLSMIISLAQLDWSSSKSLITVTTWNRYSFQVVCLNLVSYSMACSSFPHTLQIRAVACLPFRSFPSTIILWLFSIIDFVPSNPMHCNACK